MGHKSNYTGEQVDGLLDEVGKGGFIALFNAAAGPYGKYDYENAPDKEKPFYLNKLWLSWAEAVDVYENGRTEYPNPARPKTSVKTNMLIRGVNRAWCAGLIAVNLQYVFSYAQGMEVVRLTEDDWADGILFTAGGASGLFYGCTNLREVIGNLDFLNQTSISSSIFASVSKLETIHIRRLKCNLSLRDCKVISLESLQYLVANAANTSAITVTVHADVYAKLTEGDAEWQKVLSDAVEKNISFATA